MSDNTLRNYLGSTTKGDFGVEIETEFSKRCSTDKLVDLSLRSGKFSVIEDGSLRNGFEFVTRGAQFFSGITLSIKDIYQVLSKIETRGSPRTSTHIHVSCLDLDSTKLLNFIILAWYFEDFIGENCKNYRKENNFCIRVSQAEQTVFNIVQLLRENQTMFTLRLSRDRYKYSATNLVRLSDLGTLEFRQFHFTPNETDVINWCANLLSMRQYAEKCKSPETLFQMLCNRTFEENAKIIFKDPTYFGDPAPFNQRENNLFLISKIVDTYDLENNYWAAKKDVPKKNPKFHTGRLRDSEIRQFAQPRSLRTTWIIDDDI
jgi:hypothetical protein